MLSNKPLEFLLNKVRRKSVPLSRGYAFQPSHYITCIHHRMVPCSSRFRSVARIVRRRSFLVSSGSCTSVLRVHHGHHVRRDRSVRHFSCGFFRKASFLRSTPPSHLSLLLRCRSAAAARCMACGCGVAPPRRPSDSRSLVVESGLSGPVDPRDLPIEPETGPVQTRSSSDGKDWKLRMRWTPGIQWCRVPQGRKKGRRTKDAEDRQDVTSDETSHKNSQVHARVERRISFRSWPFRQP